MNLLHKFLTFLLLLGFYLPSYAAVDTFDLSACAVYSDSDSGDKKDDKKGGKKEGEEEPDCE